MNNVIQHFTRMCTKISRNHKSSLATPDKKDKLTKLLFNQTRTIEIFLIFPVQYQNIMDAQLYQ